MGYLTADSVPRDTVCRVLTIPNDQRFIANVLGAIERLTFASSYDLFGTLTVQDMADANLPMFNALCFNQGICRMIGEVICYAGPTSPDPNWLLCDGSSLGRADYPDLFDAIGTIYGATDSTHFNIPDLSDRVIASPGTNAVGTYYGEAMHTLTNGEVPSHSHGYVPAIGALINGGLEAPAAAALPGTALTAASGGGGAHNNVQPTLAMNYLIVALA